ncbi:MAG: sterol desaturase family protein, partial [Flavobacteriales bacterium]|nr:sterol desaturase family protein [Flavobacteriales bacterium]
MDIPKSMIVELSIPIFFLLIGIELIFNRAQNKDYYRLNDALSSISNGIGSEVIGIFSKLLLFSAYIYIFENWKFVDIGESWWAWTILFLGVDFTYYWFHRKSHEVNFIWAAHIVHHSSEEYNLTTALRQAWFQN